MLNYDCELLKITIAFPLNSIAVEFNWSNIYLLTIDFHLKIDYHIGRVC